MTSYSVFMSSSFLSGVRKNESQRVLREGGPASRGKGAALAGYWFGRCSPSPYGNYGDMTALRGGRL